MNWYLTKLTFSINAEYINSKAQFDEQLRLISATDELDAYFRAKKLGKELQAKIFNENREAIFWDFIDVSEVCLLDEIKDGAEVYSSTHETEEKETFINSVRLKGMAIQSRHLIFA